MKIYIAPTPQLYRPEKIVNYPIHHDDYGVEQDFYNYLTNHKDLITNSPSHADWIYIPIYWTRWYVEHDYGKSGITQAQDIVNKMCPRDIPAFTVCQYDDGPLIKHPKLNVFLSARKSRVGYDIPLLSKRHQQPIFKPKKKYLASFVGRLHTHSIRTSMYEELRDKPDIRISSEVQGEKQFVKTILESYISLCPRGYGGNSFRFYESMQLGVAPILIGDYDTRPYKKVVDWGSCSFYVNNTSEIYDLISSMPKDKIIQMGKNAKTIYSEFLDYGKWPIYLLQELAAI